MNNNNFFHFGFLVQRYKGVKVSAEFFLKLAELPPFRLPGGLACSWHVPGSLSLPGTRSRLQELMHKGGMREGHAAFLLPTAPAGSFLPVAGARCAGRVSRRMPGMALGPGMAKAAIHPSPLAPKP